MPKDGILITVKIRNRMAKHGAIFVYGGHAPKEEFTIIDNQDYQLTVKKSWVEPTSQWHLQFTSKLTDYPCGQVWECFLTKDELAKLKDIL
jgi:hypothetical protein